MKLRTTHNSIRIRLKKSELAVLDQDGQIEESISFLAGRVFRFGLRISEEKSDLKALFENDFLQILLPKNKAQTWINTNQVGMESWELLGNGEKLHLLIEKDFPCLDRVEEDKSDTFWELSSDKPDAC